MPEKVKQKVLIVDDIKDNIKVLIDLLKPEYKTFFATNGEKALELAQNMSPDIILLDIVMPEMDGFEVCQKLKSNPITCDIPVIFISAMSDIGDETKGLEVGAVDYITKPISPAIVKARVKNHLKLQEAMQELKRLYNTALDSNPNTGLPGNNSVAKQIKSALDTQENLCVIYSDLDNFKAFNDKYGFALGDEVIKFTCQVFQDVIGELNIKDAFIGHIGGDDFVLIVPSDLTQTVAEKIIQRFDHGVIKFYSSKDAEIKCIQSVDRQGESQIFPIMSISLAGVDLAHGIYKEYMEVNDVCATTKKIAKSMPGSSFFLNRRDK
ncbi:response regulator receiver modulated diguanylate cyclase [Psychromonas ingrahamii 37]|uniref:Response regulator receiver modulated diguanylate cyclase n=1 Tax=Psychromonas ingrahamii (strain DSM 17664 / CCUG 51855 / 37) TaxID=357804 RepID=A1STK3_PSYIN|nr:response regulator [Psychromonas ingrahamii]ABM02818.1 response regulator receiver modulated diguanylate cyclase [Psychromonas ingrahamii 37]